MNNKLPKGWQVKQLKEFLDPQSLFCDGDWVESKDQDEEGSNRLIQLADIGEGKFLDKSNRYLNDRQFNALRCTALEDGDILIARMPDPIGRSCLFKDIGQRCATVVDVAILRNPCVDREWLSQAINSSYVRRQIESGSSGTTRTRISRGLLSNLLIITPRPEIQQKIAHILQTIDRAIEHTVALIEKYRQIKAGLMHDLFTRGIGADGKLRPLCEQAPHLYQKTPIGWIPKEWEFCPIDEVLSKIIDYRGKTPEKTVDGVPLITAKNVRTGYIDPDPREFIAEADYSSWMTRGMPRKDDVLFTTEAPLGNVAQIDSDERVAFAQRVIILQTKEKMDSSFLAYRLMTNTTQNAFVRLASGSTALGIKQSEFRKIIIAYPKNRSEQIEVVSKLKASDEFLDSEFETIQKLQKQKSGLMYDLLTGKVPVTVSDDIPASEPKARAAAS
jgi:type I restriction enzyme S subunit